WTNSFVSFLCCRIPGSVVARFIRYHFATVELGRLFTCRRDGLRGEDDRVGTHVGDVTVFVQPLGNLHGHSRREAQAPRGFLLQRRRGERSSRTTTIGFVLSRGDRELGAFQTAGHRLSGCL